jgi:hypothetical protein
MRKSAFSIVSILILTACGSSVDNTTGGHGGSGGAGGGGASSPQTFSVTFGPVTIDAGEEDTQCVVRKLSNTKAIHVGEIHNVLGVGSHHLIVYRTNDTAEQTTPFKCQPFTDLLHPEKGTPLMISQKKDDTLTLPKGVAFGIGHDDSCDTTAKTCKATTTLACASDADCNAQYIRLEMHYINTTQASLDVTATSTFIQMNEADFQNEADFLFVGDPDINVPAHGTQTLGPVYSPLPAQLSGVNFFGFTGHEHQWGTGVTVATTTGKTGTDTPVYDVPGWTWSEPKTVYHDPPIQVPDGGGFRYTCNWSNQSNATVKFGESANNEMCFFWSYYYPSKGAFVVAHTDQFMAAQGGYDLTCPGNPFCSMIFP